MRMGIAFYGVLSHREDLEELPVRLEPVHFLKARVAQVEEVSSGEGVGYGPACRAETPLRIAVLIIGYGEGLLRLLSSGVGRVLLCGHSAPSWS